MKRVLPGAGILLAALAACAQQNSPKTSANLQTAAASIDTDIDALYPPPPDWDKINAQLNAPIGDFDVDKQPLTAAFDKFRARTHLDINVNWAAIAAANVDANAPITIHLHNVPARWVLAALMPLTAKGEHGVGYIIHNGKIWVSQNDNLMFERFRATYQYDIDPLLSWESKKRGETRDDSIKEIISTITTTVDPESWRSAGGTVAALRELNNVLIIDQTEANHEQIRQLLKSMAAETIPTIRIYDVRTLIAAPNKDQSAQRLADLEDLIRAHCPPDGWGNHGAMNTQNGRLIIAANALSQFRIAALLAAVQEIDSPQAAAPNVARFDPNILFPPAPGWESTNDHLNQNISDFTIDNQALNTALNKLHDLTHLDFVVDWTKLNINGVDRDATISIDLHHVPVRRVLDALLSAVGEDQTSLGYAIHDRTVWISIGEGLHGANYQVFRHYDIDPLIRWEMKIRGVSDEDARQTFLRTVEDTIAADSWMDNGGTVGTIREWHHVLYINQTEQNQEAIRQLLISLTAKAVPITRIYDVRAQIASPDTSQSARRLKQVERTIRKYCPLETWGIDGVMTPSNGFLIISANAVAQVRIAALMAEVRKVGDQTNKPEVK